MLRVIEAKPLPGHRLEVRFSDGVEGVYHVKPQERGGVFLPLNDPHIFASVRINPDFGCVEWPGGADLCPTAMHDDLLAGAS